MQGHIHWCVTFGIHLVMCPQLCISIVPLPLIIPYDFSDFELSLCLQCTSPYALGGPLLRLAYLN